jgi:2-methylcitrate dehydratase PrpD
MGAGLLEANRTGGTVKRVHCGWAARCGVAAADLAHRPSCPPPSRVPSAGNAHLQPLTRPTIVI